MSRASIVFATLLIVLAILTLNSIGELPEKIAVHFDAKGAADAWMSREDYRVSGLLFLVALPLILFWIMAGLPRLTKGKGQIPNNEYWFADERRPQTELFLSQHASWLGSMTVAVVYGMHIFITHANTVSPPQFTADRFLTMIFIYSCGLVWWTMTFLRHFQKAVD